MLRNIVRIGAFKSFAFPIQQTVGIRSVGARSLWHMSKPTIISNKKCTGFAGCQCGCGKRFSSTNGEKALIEFLNEEIAETKPQSEAHLPSQIDGFQIKFDVSEVELTKSSPNEQIVIKFNVNHSVDSDDEQNQIDFENQEQTQPEQSNLLSKPNFEVDIVKKDTTLSLSCTFLGGPPKDGEYDDVFGIEELTIFKGEYSEKVYACAGDMLDGYFYDLLMNLLSEKGVTDDFVMKISQLSTQYEQSLFINLLEETKKFLESK